MGPIENTCTSVSKCKGYKFPLLKISRQRSQSIPFSESPCQPTSYQAIFWIQFKNGGEFKTSINVGTCFIIIVKKILRRAKIQYCCSDFQFASISNLFFILSLIAYLPRCSEHLAIHFHLPCCRDLFQNPSIDLVVQLPCDNYGGSNMFVLETEIFHGKINQMQYTFYKFLHCKIVSK